jgi:hypothetical protein
MTQNKSIKTLMPATPIVTSAENRALSGIDFASELRSKRPVINDANRPSQITISALISTLEDPIETATNNVADMIDIARTSVVRACVLIFDPTVWFTRQISSEPRKQP